MKRTRQVVLLLFVTVAAMSWQTSLRAQAVARVGVVVSDLSAAEGHVLGLPDRGVFVVDVRSGTSAARAGILARDVIFELDGGPLHGIDDFICRVSRKQPGDSVEFQILRSLKPLTITVSLGTWPKELSLSRRTPAGCGVVDAPQPDTMSFREVDRIQLLDFDHSEVKLGLSSLGFGEPNASIEARQKIRIRYWLTEKESDAEEREYSQLRGSCRISISTPAISCIQRSQCPQEQLNVTAVSSAAYNKGIVPAASAYVGGRACGFPAGQASHRGGSNKSDDQDRPLEALSGRPGR